MCMQSEPCALCRYYNMLKTKGEANRKRRRADKADADDSDAEDAASGEDSEIGACCLGPSFSMTLFRH